MTALITALALSLLILSLAVYLIVGMALRILAAEQLIAAQREAIRTLEETTVAQRERLRAQAEHSADVEEHAAVLERIQKRNLRAAIAVMPVIDRPYVLGRAGDISMN